MTFACEISENERAVIEAAVEWAMWREGMHYGPAGKQLKRAECDLEKAVSDLHSEHDGRWSRNNEPADGPMYRCDDPECEECNRAFGRGTPYGSTKRKDSDRMSKQFDRDELRAILAQYEGRESYEFILFSLANLRAIISQLLQKLAKAEGKQP